MRRWQQWARWSVVVVASSLLLVTVLPEVASAIGLGSLAGRLAAPACGSSGSSGSGSSGSSGSGSSGSSGSGSSTCPPPSGTITATVTVTGAPAGFTPGILGFGACPANAVKGPGQACANPTYSLGSPSTLGLSPGSWWIAGFYENSGFGGAFLGTPRIVQVHPGSAYSLKLQVPYLAPASISGTVTVTGIPTGLTYLQPELLLCPSWAPFTGATPSIACVQGYVNTVSGTTTQSGPYALSGLPPGTWTAYPGYCAYLACDYNAHRGKVVTLSSATPATADVSTPLLFGSNGLVILTVAVTGAPAGFNDEVGIQACGLTTVNGCVVTESTTPTDTIDTVQPAGPITATGFYLVPPYGNAVSGPAETVTVRAGTVTSATLDVPYQVLGGVTGRITVTGRPPHTKILGYSVLACPITGSSLGIGCVQEYSGLTASTIGSADRALVRADRRAPVRVASRNGFASYGFSTLTAGQWELTVSYTTEYGTYQDGTPTVVTVASGQTTVQKVTVPYQPAYEGAVKGKVVVIDAPAESGTSVVVCATDAPTCLPLFGTSVDTDGRYNLPVPAGTWWISAQVTSYGNGYAQTASSTPVEVDVTAGATQKLTLTVDAG